MEKVFSIVRQRYGLSPTDQMEDFDVNTAIQQCGVFFMSVTLQAAVHLGKDYTEKSAIYQESTQEFLDTVISSDWEVDHKSDRSYWTDHDWLAAACEERDDSAERQSCSVCNCQNLRLFWLCAMSGRYQYWTIPSMGKQD